MKSARWFLSYIFVTTISLWLAFAISTRFMSPAHSQENAPIKDVPTGVRQEMVPPPPPELEAAASSGAIQAKPAPVPVDPGLPPPEASQSSEENPLGESLAADGYIYNPAGRRDPFKPFRASRPNGPDTGAPVELEPLQKFEIEKIQVVGILWDVKNPRAMMRDPNGAMHTVVKNSKIGRSEGFVAAIREGEVVIVETQYEEGQARKSTRVMELVK